MRRADVKAGMGNDKKSKFRAKIEYGIEFGRVYSGLHIVRMNFDAGDSGTLQPSKFFGNAVGVGVDAAETNQSVTVSLHGFDGKIIYVGLLLWVGGNIAYYGFVNAVPIHFLNQIGYRAAPIGGVSHSCRKDGEGFGGKFVGKGMGVKIDDHENTSKVRLVSFTVYLIFLDFVSVIF
jgi:hypothetical protein